MWNFIEIELIITELCSVLYSNSFQIFRNNFENRRDITLQKTVNRVIFYTLSNKTIKNLIANDDWSYRYKQHKTDFDEIPSTRPISVPCRVPGCQCSSYHYVPLNGTQPIRCTCKHFTDDHSERKPYKCLKGCSCKKFWSAFTCSCGNPAHSHKVSGIFPL